MSTLRQAAQQALAALENQRILTTRLDGKVKEVTPVQITNAITALRAALAESVDEDDTIYCPTCGIKDGGTSCGYAQCGLIYGEQAEPRATAC